MGHKSRGNWNIGICLRDCRNRDRKCDICFKFSQYVKEDWGKHDREMEGFKKEK